jgi:hypothetical protein
MLAGARRPLRQHPRLHSRFRAVLNDSVIKVDSLHLLLCVLLLTTKENPLCDSSGLECRVPGLTGLLRGYASLQRLAATGRATTKRDGEEVLHGLHKVSKAAGQVKADLDGVELSGSGRCGPLQPSMEGRESRGKSQPGWRTQCSGGVSGLARTPGAIEAHDAEQAISARTAAWALW